MEKTRTIVVFIFSFRVGENGLKLNNSEHIEIHVVAGAG